MPWEIQKINVDSKAFYRVHVSGVNTEHPVPQPFSWAVPALDDARYAAHENAEPDVVRMVRSERALVLAKAFAGGLALALSRDELAEAVERNATEGNASVCHSHDHCDANMVMAEAFVAVFGREPLLAGERDTEDLLTWNEAWMMAKAAAFWRRR